MAIRRRCRGPCRTTRRCLEHLWFDVKYRGIRYRMPVNEFAVPRMQPGKQRPVESLEEARDWQRLFIGGIKGGHDPPQQAGGQSARGRLALCLGISRRLLRAAGQTGSPAEYRCHAEPDQGPESIFRRAAGQVARGGGDHQPVQERLGVRRRGGNRDPAQGTGDAACRDPPGARPRDQRSSRSRRSIDSACD
jgi:hypothetical protein